MQKKLTPLQQEVQQVLVRTGRMEGHTGSQEISLMQETSKSNSGGVLTSFQARLVDSMQRDILIVTTISGFVAKILEIDPEKYTKKGKPSLQKKVQEYAGKIHDKIFQARGVSTLTQNKVEVILTEVSIETIREQLFLLVRLRRQACSAMRLLLPSFHRLKPPKPPQ